MASLLLFCPNSREAADRKFWKVLVSDRREVFSGIGPSELNTTMGGSVVSCCVPKLPCLARLETVVKVPLNSC